MSFRSTEISVRQVLLDELRSRNVHVGHELSVPLPKGRMAPDAVLANGGDYVLETKLGGEGDYFQDLMKLTDWLKLRSLPIKGAFAVLIPGELRQVDWKETSRLATSPNAKYEVSALFRDDRPGDRKLGTISEIADWIAKQVLRPTVEAEPDTDFVIKVLAGAVTHLSMRMRNLQPEELEDIFGGSTVFDSILEVKPKRMPVDEFRKAASYLLINQLLFYHVLSRAEPDLYEQIDPNSLNHPSDLTKYFLKVLKVDYAPTFGFDIASRLSEESVDTIRSVVEIIQLMRIAGLRQDLLGKVFHNLIPLSVRKPVAAYYTNKQAGDLLAALAIRRDNDVILDPACGSGTLLVASYQRKRSLIEESGRGFTERDHRRFLGKEVTGIDIMPFATHLAVVHLSLQIPSFISQKVRIAVWDSTALKPGNSIPSLSRELARAFRIPTLDMFDGGHPKGRAKYIERGVVTPGGFGGEELQLEPVDVVIMNPPFTSSDRLGSDYKDLLKRRFASEYQEHTRGKIGLHGYFLLLADRFLKKDGILAAVLPQTTLTGETFAPIVQMLTSEYTIRAIVVGLGRSAFSENTALSEILLVAEKLPPSARQRFPLIGTKTDPIEWTPSDIQDLVARADSARDSDDGLATVKWVNQEELSIDRGGFASLLPQLSRGYEWLVPEFRSVMESSLMIPYSEIENKLGVKALISPLGNKEVEGPDGRGGVFYGASALNICRSKERALKKVDRLILTGETSTAIHARDRVTGTEVRIPRSAVVPTVRRISHYGIFDVTDQTDIIVSKAYSDLPNVLRAIYGEEKSRLFITRIRERWPERIQQGMSRLFLERRVDIASPGTHHIAVCTKDPAFTGRGPWGVRGINEDDAKLLCLWFNSSLFLFQMVKHRTQTRGTWWELSKHHFEKTYVPDISKLSPEQRKKILATYRHLSRMEFPSLLEQLEKSFDGRRELDKTWLSILGVPDSEQNRLVDRLHSFLSSTLTSLQHAMKKD